MVIQQELDQVYNWPREVIQNIMIDRAANITKHGDETTWMSIIILVHPLWHKGKLRGCSHEISFQAKWNIFVVVSGQVLITAYMIRPRMRNLLRVLFYCGHFDRNEISFRVIKYHVNTTRNETIWKETSAHV